MAELSGEINTRLDRVRHRWRRLEIIKAVSVGVVEALGLLMVFMLVDYLYAFSSAVRAGLLLVWIVAVLVVVARYVARPLRRQITDADLALFVERRNPELQGALLSATEFAHDRGTPLHNFIVDVLIREANRRIRFVDIRKTLDFSRLRKYAGACLVVIAVFVLTGALFPRYFLRHTHRVLVPWSPEPAERDSAWPGGLLDPNNLAAPIRFRITPGDIEVLQGGSVQVVAELSRDPLREDVTLFIKSGRSEWGKVAMKGIERIYTHAATIEDVTTPLEYYVGVGQDASKHYQISVRKRLRVVGLEMTTESPAYLRRPPVTTAVYSGDIATLKGSKVTVNVKTNQRITDGKFVMSDGSEVPLVLGSSGGKATLAIEADDTYRYVVRNEHGEEVGSDRLFFIQALPDRPPTMEVLEPNNDLTVQPLSEITCSLEVSEDWALDAVRMHMELVRQGEGGVPQRRPLVRDFLPPRWTARVDEGTATLTLALDEFKPLLANGDAIFYHFEVEDRKKQKTASDLFFVSVSHPEVFIFYGDMTIHGPEARIPISPLFQFIAAAWNLERQRGTLPAGEFLEKSRMIARKMLDPVSGELIDFIRLGVNGDGKGPILADSDPRKKIAADHTKAGYELLNQGEPGKAVFELKLVWAILKQFLGDKAILLAADFPNPNAVILEPTQDFAQVIADLSKMEMRELSDLDLERMPDQQVSWRRKLGRKEMEKVADARKDIEKLKRDVEQIARDARDERGDDTERGPGTEEGERAPQRQGEGVKQPRQEGGQQQPSQARAGEGTEGDQDRQRETEGEDARGDDTLARRAQRAARGAEDVARRLQQAIGDRDDRNIDDGLDNLRGAADQLRLAAGDFDGDEIDAGAARARTAGRLLDQADKDLADLKFGRLDEMVAVALSHAYRLAGRQTGISKATDQLAKSSDDVQEAKKKGDRRADAEQQLVNEKAGALAKAQTALSEKAEVFKTFVERMQQAADEGKEGRVAGLVGDGVKTMKRRELPQKMVDAAVEIAQGNFRAARPPQDDASGTIQSVIDSLYRASDALAGTRQGALERAARRARDIKKKTLELAKLEEKDVPGAGGKPDAEGKEAEGKDEGTPGDKQGEGGKETEVAGGEDEGTEGGDRRGGDGLSRTRRGREASGLWSDVRTLAGDLRSMEYVPEGARQRLSTITEDEFRGMFDKLDDERLRIFIGLIGRLSKLLDEKLLEAQTARKLESGLREECPPAYRRLVGRYYSVLSAGD